MLKCARSCAPVDGSMLMSVQAVQIEPSELKNEKRGHEVGREWKVGVDLGCASGDGE